MQHGKRQAEWDHTAALMQMMQVVNGVKNAKFDNPYSDRSSDRDEWEKLKKQKRGIKDE